MCNSADMGSSADREFRKWGVHEMGSWGDEEFRRWDAKELGSLRDGEFTRWGVQEMGISAEGNFTRWGVQELIKLQWGPNPGSLLRSKSTRQWLVLIILSQSNALFAFWLYFWVIFMLFDFRLSGWQTKKPPEHLRNIAITLTSTKIWRMTIETDGRSAEFISSGKYRSVHFYA